MRNKLTKLVAGLLLVLGASVALPASPASAHQYSAGTFWVCGSTRPYNSTVYHSWPSHLNPGVLTVYCRSAAYEWYSDWHSDGTIVRVTSYRDCGVYNCGGAGGH